MQTLRFSRSLGLGLHTTPALWIRWERLTENHQPTALSATLLQKKLVLRQLNRQSKAAICSPRLVALDYSMDGNSRELSMQANPQLGESL